MQLTEMFKEAGITGNESKAYMELLKKGELGANSIAKSISMDRTLTYTVLNHLIDKGFVTSKIKDKKKIFQAENPKLILDNLRKKEIVLKDLVKELSQIKVSNVPDIEVKLYEGIEGVRSVSKIMMSAKHIDAFGATGRLYDMLYEAAPLAKEMIKKGYTSRVILPRTVRGHDFTKYKGVKTRVLDVNSEATTTIFDDYVIIHLIKDKPLAILIKNKFIASSYLSHFEILWGVAK